MKPLRLRSDTRPDLVAEGSSLTVGLGLLLAAWLNGPIQAEVIDDFEEGFRFWCNGSVEALDTDISTADGELCLNLPADAVGSVGDWRIYGIPEGREITFQVDLVNSSSAWYRGVAALFGFGSQYRAPGGGYPSYGIYRLPQQLVLSKDSDEGVAWLVDWRVPIQRGSETISLSLKRQGNSMALTGMLIERDSGRLIQKSTFLDTPAVDPTATRYPDNGAPYHGPTSGVFLISSARTDSPAEVVYDNFVCSEDPMPLRVKIERTSVDAMAVRWDSDAVLFVSDSPDGGWSPCAEPISAFQAGYAARVPVKAPQRFFRLAPGLHLKDDFGSGAEWRIGKAVPDAPGADLTFAPLYGRGRAYGSQLGHDDFVMRARAMSGSWWGDCVASVDLVAWEPDMEEGSALGIVLRANPENWFWFIEETGLPENRYLGLLTFKRPGVPSESILSITGPGGAVLQESSLPAVDPAQDYGLRFRAVGDRLTLELCDLEAPETPIATCSATDGRSPCGIEALFVTPSPTGVTRIDVDNFFVRGVPAVPSW